MVYCVIQNGEFRQCPTGVTDLVNFVVHAVISYLTLSRVGYDLRDTVTLAINVLRCNRHRHAVLSYLGAVCHYVSTGSQSQDQVRTLDLRHLCHAGYRHVIIHSSTIGFNITRRQEGRIRYIYAIVVYGRQDHHLHYLSTVILRYLRCKDKTLFDVCRARHTLRRRVLGLNLTLVLRMVDRGFALVMAKNILVKGGHCKLTYFRGTNVKQYTIGRGGLRVANDLSTLLYHYNVCRVSRRYIVTYVFDEFSGLRRLTNVILYILQDRHGTGLVDHQL